MIFADTNWLVAVLAGGDSEAGRRCREIMQDVGEPLHLSPLVAHELRGVLRRLGKEPDPPAWRAFKDDPDYVTVTPDWPELLEVADRLQRRFCPRTALGALDALHLAAAQSMGATHFFSFDRNSDLRPCAIALGFRLQPLPSREERERARGL